jgi:SAM-dependent methyltransferase
MEGLEVWTGALVCGGCVRRFPVTEGIPRLLEGDAVGVGVTSRTAARYGQLWSRSVVADRFRSPPAYHFERIQQGLSLPPLQGLVLDAGCGDGIDLANQARRPGLELIGIELSAGGCRASLARCRTLPNAFVVQGDLSRLPFEDHTFDFVYSYGVLHHLPSPADGLRELVRVLKPGLQIAVYLYEDFRDRSLFWRGLLAAANACRRLTTALPPALLFRLCQAGSPIIYALFTGPHRLLTHIPGCRSFAATIPFRHGTGPCSLAGDLYDRFSAPIEQRYTRGQALTLLRQAGLEAIRIVNDRGWMVVGTKPLGTPPVSDAPASVGQPEAQGHR